MQRVLQNRGRRDVTASQYKRAFRNPHLISLKPCMSENWVNKIKNTVRSVLLLSPEGNLLYIILDPPTR